jgi:hypothetical protein
VFHTFDSAGARSLETALATLREIGPGGTVPVGEFIDRVIQRGFEWGVSDGN